MRRALAVAAALVVALGVVLSPVADLIARRVAMTGQQGSASIRMLNYDISPARLRGAEAYPAVLSGIPENVTNLYVMGSSEFGTDVDSNGSRFFPRRVSDFDMFFSGRGYEQSLFHAVELGAVSRQLRPKKVAFILSPQWFTPSGALPAQFDVVFSGSFFSQMLTNPDISPATRARLVSRAAELEPGLCVLTDGCPGGPAAKAKAALDTPYFMLSSRTNRLKESYQAIQVNKKYGGSYAVADGAVPVSQIDWKAERESQAQVAATKVTNNEFGFADSWFKPRERALRAMRGTQAGTVMTSSPEYSDLQLFLDVAKDTGVEVLLVMLPENGPWVDYLGIPSRERQAYYAKIRGIAQANGVQLTDLSGNEYEQYYFWDAIHVGWKGWLDVSEACVRFARS